MPLWGFAQKNIPRAPEVLSGPMRGYAEHTECLIWVQTRCAKNIQIQYRISKRNAAFMEQRISNINKQTCEAFISKFILTDLLMGSTYEYKIVLDGITQKFDYALLFKTKSLWEWRMPPPDFTFLAGSCLYINDSIYDRPGKPYGGSTDILKVMAATPAEMMIWLGDNTYTREADYSSASGIEYRYLHTRCAKDLQPLLAKMNHYATWDDHDFGDNDGNKNFELKPVSTKCFKAYWGNKTYGEKEEGIYSSFRYSDAEFFLLDNRSFRDESELDQDKYSKTQLGVTQLSWLKNKLKHSRAGFKFVCIGGQFLNEHTEKESFNLYKRERDEIIQFILDQEISGVIFLTGDRHYTELLKNDNVKLKLGYTLYDLTASAINAGSVNISGTEEFDNPQRVANTLVMENNFCTLKISGEKRGERILLITCYDEKGLVKWGYTIKENELKAVHVKGNK